MLQPSDSLMDAMAGSSDWSEVSVFREAFRAWLEENLPADWRHRSFGASDERVLELRREFGARLGRDGWLSVAWPTAHGGLGLGGNHRLAVLEELTRAGAPEPMNSNALGIFAPTLMKFGTPEQCTRLLAPMIRHELLWCQGFSEPDAGSDLASLKTRGEITADQIVITGQKVWTSYAHTAQYCYILVRTEQAPRKHQGISLVALPMDQPGVTVRPILNMVGTSEFCEVFLENAVAPIENLIGVAGEGWQMASFALAQERSIGLAQRSLKLFSEFESLARVAEEQWGLGNTVISEEFFATDLVDRYVRARVVEATVRRIVEADANGSDIAQLSSVAKIWWSEGHQLQVDLAMRMLNAQAMRGAGDEANWWKAMLWSLAETIYGGTAQVQRNILARGLGMPRDGGRS